jgi:hypothetical protein
MDGSLASRRLGAFDPGSVKRWKRLSGNNKRIKLAAVTSLSCAIRIFRESMLRQSGLRESFHTAKTRSGHLQGSPEFQFRTFKQSQGGW